MPQVPVHAVPPAQPGSAADAGTDAAQMFLHRTSWGQTTPKRRQMRKVAWMKQTGTGAGTCGQAKLAAGLAEHQATPAPLYSPSGATIGSLISPKSTFPEEPFTLGLQRRGQSTEGSTHSPDGLYLWMRFASGNRPVMMTYLKDKEQKQRQSPSSPCACRGGELSAPL